jgi:putative transposase
MGKFKKLSHVFYKCEYHIVFVPKYRYRILRGLVKTLVEHDIYMISQWKEAEIQELSIQPDHIHVVCSVPPKVSISEFMGTLKGKLAIKLFKSYPDLKKRPYWGNHFWAKGYFVSTVGLDSEMIKRYVRYQENEERRNGKR